MSSEDLPNFDDVRDAATRLRDWAVRTPLLENPSLSARVGCRLLIKAESLQHTGSFKFRGAFNRISRLGDAERKRGVVAFSSGNHAQGVAAAAQLLQISATIVMPADAPAIKIANTRSYGAEIVLYDRATEDRSAIADRIAKERNATLIPPFDNRFIIAGQGTVGLEALDEAAGRGIAVDALVAPASGGGLVAGCALASAGVSPGTRVYAAEPVGLDDHARSLAAGHPVGNLPGAHSICDALLGTIPGEITFAINRERLAGGLVVDDDQVRHAMAIAFQELKLVLEPSGAVALAAALAGKIPGPNRAVIVVASGGNVDRDTYIAALRAAN